MVRYFLNSSPLVLEVTGKDAPRYLQSRFTQNIKALGIGGSALAAQLMPQGKTQGLFKVIRTREDAFHLLSDRGNTEAIIAAFKKYIVADRVTVTDVSSSSLVFHITDASTDSLSIPGILIQTDRGVGKGLDVITLTDDEGNAVKDWLKQQNAIVITPTEIEVAGFRLGKPRYGVEITENTVFNETGLEEAVAFNKGCYVGQEVVEKIESFGKTAKIITRIFLPLDEDTQPIPVETSVLREAAQYGTVISSCIDTENKEHICFVRIKNDPSIPVTSLTIQNKKVLR